MRNNTKINNFTKIFFIILVVLAMSICCLVTNESMYDAKAFDTYQKATMAQTWYNYESIEYFVKGSSSDNGCGFIERDYDGEIWLDHILISDQSKGLNFPAWINNKNGVYYRKVKDPVQLNLGQNQADLNSWGIGGLQTSSGNLVTNSNEITFDSTASIGNQTAKYWKYVYGFYKVPDELTKYGGNINITAQTAGYLSDSDFVKYPRKRYLTVGAGNNESISANAQPGELMQNMNTLRSVAANGVYKGGKDSNRLNTSEQSVSIEIKPGETYIRVSYVFLANKVGGDAFGQKIENVVLNCNANAKPQLVQDTISASGTDYFPSNYAVTSNEFKHTLIPYANLAYIPNSDWENVFRQQGKAKLVTNVHAPININSFASTHESCRLENDVLFFDKGKPTDASWGYFYTYIQLPNGFTGNIKISAEVASWGLNSADYMSISPGVELYNYNNNNEKAFNLTDIKHTPARGKTIGWMPENNKQNTLYTNKEINFHVEPGDKFLRLSFACFPRAEEATGFNIRNVRISNDKPAIKDVTVANNNGLGRQITATVTDSDLLKTQIFYNGSSTGIDMEKSGNIFTHTISTSYFGDVTIKAFDKFGHITEYTLNNVDIKAPTVTINNVDIVALNNKIISFVFNDNSNINQKIVKINGQQLELMNDSIDINNNGTYTIIAIDEFGNKLEQTFDVKNIVKIQEDTKLTDILLTGNTIKFNISNLDLGESVKLPVIDGFEYTDENRNFGVMANIVATIKNYVKNDTLTSATFIEKVTVPVNVNGVTKNPTIGETITTEAPVVAENQIFVGWRDERGVLVSESDVYTFTVVKATTLTPVFVEKTLTKVIFTSPSGSIIDIKALEYNTVDTIKTNIAEYNVPDPTQMFMTFAGWVVTDKGDGTFEARATFDSNATVVVTVVDTQNQEVVSEPLRYNGKQTFLGDENTVAWATKEGEEFNVIAQTKDLTIYTTATMKVYMLTQEQLNNITDKKGLYIAKHADGNGDASVTGFIDKNLNVTEVGFIIDGAEKMHINSNTAKVYPARIHPLTNQIIININVDKQDINNLSGKKVVMYAKIGNQFVYSNEVVL